MMGSNFSRQARKLFPYVISAYVCLQVFILFDVKDLRTELYPRQDYIIIQKLRLEAAPSRPSAINYTLRDPDVETHVTNDFQEKCHSRVNLIRGYPKTQKGFLTLGISSVPRINAFYLLDTLTSLISEMTEKDKSMCTIVVLMATYNSTWVDHTLRLIDKEFNSSVRSGLIQVIRPETGIYPDLTNITRRTYNDSIERVQWRSKQNIDFSLLFAYCANISKYYIHLEDDVSAATTYISDIRTYINAVDKTEQYWFVLEFSNLGFIGKLFRSSDLCMMSNFFYLFLEDKPCDFLFDDLKRIKTQIKTLKTKQALFQHVGISSSLDGKIQNLTEKHFKNLAVRRRLPIQYSYRRAIVGHRLSDSNIGVNIIKPYNENPVAKIMTNMTAYQDFRPECAYIGLKCIFWATDCTKGQFYRLLFDQPIQLYDVCILTGNPVDRVDILLNGTVTIGTESDCSATHVGDFKNGRLEVQVEGIKNVTCLQITLLESQKSWIIISDIFINRK